LRKPKQASSHGITNMRIAIKRAVTNFIKTVSPYRSKYTGSSIIPFYAQSVYFIKDGAIAGKNRYNKDACHVTMRMGKMEPRHGTLGFTSIY
jgi:hypothetical protein